MVESTRVRIDWNITVDMGNDKPKINAEFCIPEDKFSEWAHLCWAWCLCTENWVMCWHDLCINTGWAQFSSYLQLPGWIFCVVWIILQYGEYSVVQCKSNVSEGCWKMWILRNLEYYKDFIIVIINVIYLYW